MAKKKPDQLCWNCKRAVNWEPLTCPWAAFGKPIDGWKAEESTFKDWVGGEAITVHTYSIKECPLFIQDRTKIKTIEELWAGTGRNWWEDYDDEDRS